MVVALDRYTERKITLCVPLANHGRIVQLMTRLLEKAIAAAKETSPEVQDAIASRILAEINDEEVWAASFDATSDAAWDKLAADVRADIKSGGHEPLDSLLK
jgi:hypothetical protein